MIELKPCPFCHAELVSIAPEQQFHAVQCRCCSASGPLSGNPDQAARLWNTRASERERKLKVRASPENTGLTSDLACGCGPDRYCVDHRLMAAARDRTSEREVIAAMVESRHRRELTENADGTISLPEAFSRVIQVVLQSVAADIRAGRFEGGGDSG